MFIITETSALNEIHTTHVVMVLWGEMAVNRSPDRDLLFIFVRIIQINKIDPVQIWPNRNSLYLDGWIWSLTWLPYQEFG